MPDPKNEEPIDESSTVEETQAEDTAPTERPDTEPNPDTDDAAPDDPTDDSADDSTSDSADDSTETDDDPTPERADVSEPDDDADTDSTDADTDGTDAGRVTDSTDAGRVTENTDGDSDAAAADPAEAATVAMPILKKSADEPTGAVQNGAGQDGAGQEEPPSEAPTVRIPVTAHTPKALPERIEPKAPEPPKPEPAPFTPAPTPTRIPPAESRGRSRWTLIAGGAVAVVVAVVAVFLFVQYRAANSPDAAVRDSVDEFVNALTSGDLDALSAATCGSLAEFYETVDPDEFRSIHDLAVQQGSVPVVTSIDKVQITGDTAIVEVTAHTAADPSDETARTFDLTREGDEWRVCGD